MYTPWSQSDETPHGARADEQRHAEVTLGPPLVTYAALQPAHPPGGSSETSANAKELKHLQKKTRHQ